MRPICTWITKLTLLSATLVGSQSIAADFQPLAEIRQAATDFARERISISGTDSSIEAGHLDPRLRLKKCDRPLTAAPLSPRNRGTNMTVIVKCESSKPWSVYVPVKTRSYLKVAIANRPLARDIPVAADDISFERREVSRLTTGYFEEMDNLIGRLPKRSLGKGSVISPRDLDIKKVVTKGDRVSILAEGSGIAVRMPGLALSDAGKGEQVEVQNLSSKRTVIGIVIGPDLIKVTM